MQVELSNDGLGPGDLVGRRFAHLVDQLREIGVCLVKERLTAQLGANGLLEKFRRR